MTSTSMKLETTKPFRWLKQPVISLIVRELSCSRRYLFARAQASRKSRMASLPSNAVEQQRNTSSKLSHESFCPTHVAFGERGIGEGNRRLVRQRLAGADRDLVALLAHAMDPVGHV